MANLSPKRDDPPLAHRAHRALSALRTGPPRAACNKYPRPLSNPLRGALTKYLTAGARCASAAPQFCKCGRIRVNAYVCGLRFAPRRMYAWLVPAAWWRATRRAVARATRCCWHHDGHANDRGRFMMISANMCSDMLSTLRCRKMVTNS